MEKIQVLALNDDNHATCFITRGSYYSNAAKFMEECLLKPHTIEYDVRFVYLLDLEGDEDTMLNIFDQVACEYQPETLYKRDKEKFFAREKAFDYLWEIAETEYFWI